MTEDLQFCGKVIPPHWSKRLRRSDDRARRQRAEISSVERVRRSPVHEEDLAVGEDVTALPDGQRPTASVMRARRTHFDLVDRDRELISAIREWKIDRPSPSRASPPTQQETRIVTTPRHRHGGVSCVFLLAKGHGRALPSARIKRLPPKKTDTVSREERTRRRCFFFGS
jgi:hypothetical protein